MGNGAGLLVRGVVALLVASVLLVAPPSRTLGAEPLPAPVLLAPAAGSTASGLSVALAWQRVAGAAAYRVLAWPGEGPMDPDARMLDTQTVNDELVARLGYPGKPISWSVTPLASDGTPGATVTSVFIGGPTAPTLLAPADGATLTYPDVTPQVLWTGDAIWGQDAFVDAAVGESTPVAGSGSGADGAPLRQVGGTWRWTAGGSTWPWSLLVPVQAPPRIVTVTWRDAQPAMLTETGLRVSSGEPFRLAWQPVPGAWGYEYQLAPLGTLATSAITGPMQDTGADIGGWLPPATYEWRVRANATPYASGTGASRPGPWSPTRTIIVEPAVVPAQVSPAAGATLADWPLLRWEAVETAAEYEVQVNVAATAGGATTTSPVPAIAFRAENPSWSAGGIWSVSGGTRYWRVRAVNAGRLYSDWSPWRSFTVDPARGPELGSAEAAPLLGPATCEDGAGCSELPGIPLLRWQSVPGATFYRVFTDVSGGATLETSVDVAGTAYPFTQYSRPTADARTTWAVVACPSAATCPSSWSGPVRGFRAGIEAPVQLAPADESAQVEPVIHPTWSAVSTGSADALPTPVEYEVDFRYLVEDAEMRFSTRVSGGALSTGWISPWGFPEDAVVRWRVRAGWPSLVGAWSAFRTVRRALPPVVLTTPGEGETVTGRPALSWVPGGYTGEALDIQILADDALGDIGWLGAGWRLSTTAASIIPYPELPPGPYTWRVSRGGAWTYGHFTVGGNPLIALTSPVAGASVPADDIDLEWEAMPGIEEYIVLIGDSPTVTSADAIYTGGTNSTRHHVTARLSEGAHYWRVCGTTPTDQTWLCGEAATLNPRASEVRTLTLTASVGAADTVAPVVSGLAAKPRSGATVSVSGSIPAQLRWTASDVGSGLAAIEVGVTKGTDAERVIPLPPSARSLDVTLAAANPYRVRVRARDGADNVSAWKTLDIAPRLVQETSTAWRWSSGWTRSTSASASGGAARWAKARGASASLTTTMRAIALVAPRSTTRGSATVWIDGVKVATIKLYAEPTGARRIVFTRSWSSAGSHRITIKVLGTAGHPRVDIDALVVIR